MKGTGLPPWDAVEKFADPKLLRESQRLRGEEEVLGLMVRHGWPLNNLGKQTRRYLKLQKRILDTFEAALSAGEYVATGFVANAALLGEAPGNGTRGAGTVGRRTTIPREMWSTLKLDYQNATASGGGFEFAAILIRPRSRGDIAAEKACLNWLKEEVARGYEPKTKAAMWEKVKVRFGDRISGLAFQERIWPEVAEASWRTGGRKPSK